MMDAAAARILSHPILVIPDAGEYADADEDCMVVGDFADSTHLFQSVLVPEVHDSIRALPNGPLPFANSVVLMKAEDFEKLRGRRATKENNEDGNEAASVEALKTRIRALDAEVRALKLDNETKTTRTLTLLQACHEARRRTVALEAEVKERDGKLAKLRRTRDVRARQLSDDLYSAHVSLAAVQATLATTQGQLTTTQDQLAATQAQLSATHAELATTQAQLSATQAQLSACQVDLAAETAKSKTCETLNVRLCADVARLNSQVEERDAQVARLDAELVHLLREKEALQCELNWAEKAVHETNVGDVLDLLEGARG